MARRSFFLFVGVLIAAIATVPARAQDAKPQAARLVFVLHSGLHTILSDRHPDWAIDIIHDNLLLRGVAERDIVMVPCPFAVASWQDMFPREGLEYYLDLMKPESQASQKAYVRLDRMLRDQGVGPRDRIIWIGHSAGGQVGLTMAHLANNLTAYPELAKTTCARRFDTVVTLGSPLGSVMLPDCVKQRHYFSPEDVVVRLACSFGSAGLNWLGYEARLTPIPPQFGGNCVVRIFQGMHHAYWPDARVVARILADVRMDRPASWRSLPVTPNAGSGLSSLLCRALEEQYQLSLEDPFE